MAQAGSKWSLLHRGISEVEIGEPSLEGLFLGSEWVGAGPPGRPL